MSVIKNELSPTSQSFQNIHDERSPLLSNQDLNTLEARTEVIQGKLWHCQWCRPWYFQLVTFPSHLIFQDLSFLVDDERPISTVTNNILSPRIFQINYILLGMFCCLAFLQNSVFVEWNPIANSALAVFSPEWSPATLAWQINLATITSPFIQWPVWVAIQKYGKCQK